MIDNDIRLLAVERFKTLDLSTDSEFRELVQMASETCDTPVAMLTLIDKDTQWLRATVGTDVTEMPREATFCTYTIQDDDVMVVPNALEDKRFADLPNVANAPNVRFYAGVPLISRQGQRIGSICVIDLKPRELDKQQLLMLKMLSRQAINMMEFRISVELLESNKIEADHQREVIRKAEIALRSFFESAPNFQVLLSRQGAVIDFNKVAYDFIKKVYGAELTKGSNFEGFLAQDFIGKFNKGFKLALQGKHAFEEGSTDYGAHGIMYWEASFETARDANNEIIGISYIIRDVSDRKTREHKILAQNQSLLKIAHLQAHEFRAPLTTITGMMDLIKDQANDAPKEYFELLEKAVNNLDNKIREVVDNVDNIVLEGTEVYVNK